MVKYLAVFFAMLVIAGCTDEEMELAGMMAPKPTASKVKAAAETREAFISAIRGQE